MEKLTESMAPAFLSRNMSSFTTFMINYSALDTSHRVLDQLFTSAISSLVGTFLDPGQDFWEPLHFPCFRMKLTSLHLSSPGSELGTTPTFSRSSWSIQGPLRQIWKVRKLQYGKMICRVFKG
ncbi:ral guanine nucleotide dissociation stimulator-like [Diceros bicornis minor]|uniref:ral guanine nucleotide dissociation stimulator-like n=1 Tax=Diceros bicornis minor TaxID=77932 RepID=UPI0026F340E1|nr:ral guanine nucleotide dissociation stimulator-like [Diceros bicornis minor]